MLSYASHNKQSMLIKRATADSVAHQETKRVKLSPWDLNKLELNVSPERYPNFGAIRLHMRVTEELLRLDVHDDTPPADTANAMDAIEYFFNEILVLCCDHGGLGEDYVHLYMSTPGVDFTFAFNPTGPDIKTLRQLLYTNGREPIMRKFMALIQSNNKVRINQETSVLVYLFRAPSGSGKRTKCLRPKQLLQEHKCVREVRTLPGTHVCMGAAIILSDFSRTGRGTDKWDGKDYHYFTRKDRSTSVENLTWYARELCIAADVDWEKPAGVRELAKFGRYLNLNLHVYKLVNGDLDASQSFHSPFVENGDHRYLLLVNDHYHCISNMQGLLRSYRNIQRTICDSCQQIFFNSSEKRNHECSGKYELPEE